MMNSSISYDHIKMPPPATYDRVIQYHAQEGWGQYSHTIRLYQEDQQYLIDLKFNIKKGPERTLQTIRKKIELKPDDVEAVWAKAKSMYCKEVDLEPDFTIVDGVRFQLLIKDSIYWQGFEWQIMDNRVRYGRGRIPGHKDEVTEIVGDLMRLCQFPNGEKFIYIDSFNTSGDSVAFQIFLGYAYNVLKYKVYLDDKLLGKDPEGIAIVKVPVTDTINFRKRIRINAELLDKREIEF